MVTKQLPKPAKFLSVPTRPVSVDRDRSVAGLLEKMEGTGFGGRQLAESHRIWLDMMGDNTTIMCGASGELVAAGMRRVLSYVIKNRFVDVLVLSGSVVFQDLHETLGRSHFQAHPSMADEELEASNVGRALDVLSSHEEYREAGEWVSGFVNQLENSRPYSTREFLNLMGRELSEISTEDGILTAAFKSRVPVFCPDISDSLITVGIASGRYEKKNSFAFDLAQDVLDMVQITARSRSTSLINIGGGAPRSFIHQTEHAIDIVKQPARGHKYAIQYGNDAPSIGGQANLTATNDALIFGKLQRGAPTAFVDCDATIALPIVITSLSQTAVKYLKGRKRPSFTFNARELGIEVT